MPDIEDCDVPVLGGGEAGKYLAWEMARLGRRTVVVERGLIGGSCANIACLPSKNVIRSAKVADLNHRAAEFGLVTGETSIDMIGVRRHKREMVDGLIEIHRNGFKANGLEFILGEGRFIVPKTVEVRLNDGGTRRVSGQRVFLDVGTDAAIPDVPGLKVRIAKLPMSAVLRARAIAETQGYMKTIIDAKSDRLLGFTMLGAGAGEVVAVVQTAMLAACLTPA